MVVASPSAPSAVAVGALGGWTGPEAPAFDADGLIAATARFREPAHVVVDPATRRHGVALGGSLVAAGTDGAWPVVGSLPCLYPEWLGDRSFAEAHGTRFPYVTGAMANGIATTRLVAEIARTGGLGFFGAAGLDRGRVEQAVDELRAELDPIGAPWGANLIHSPQEPRLESSVVDLYLARGVRRVSAAAFMALTPNVVRYAASGLHVDGEGRVQRPNMVIAKLSRPEVARRFLRPAPDSMLDALVADGSLTRDEADLARTVPVVEDVTVESDSGGHTDNRPLAPLLAAMQAERDAAVREHGSPRPIRLGAAGGIGTPQAVAGAFALGASYVLTGTVNQACVESGLSVEGRAMLAAADLADVTMAPAADMFELGVDLQVLKRGTMFAPRAQRLRRMYRERASLDELPAAELAELESILGGPIDQAWASTAAFWAARDPEQLERAERDPRHRLALVLRSYLGLSSRWAIEGTADRRLDYQIWCGPAMGAFNAWTAGTFLADPAERTVAQVARNLLEGASVVTRAQQLRSYGVPIPAAAFDHRPRRLETAVDR